MKLVPSRSLAVRPGEVWEAMEREGAVVITKDGVPRSIMLPTNDESFIEDVQDFVFGRARRATRAIREHAAASGLDRLNSQDIDKEIQAVRRMRRKKRGGDVGS